MTRRVWSVLATLAVLVVAASSAVLLSKDSGEGEAGGEAAFRQELPESPRACAEKGKQFEALGRNPGPRATVHGLDGRTIDDPDLLARAPKPDLLPTPETGFEPSLGVTSDGAIFTVGSTCETPGEQNAPFSPVLRSRDGGRSFLDVSPRIAGTPTHPKSLGPYLYVDKDTDRVFTADVDAPGACNPISGSGNGGATWLDSQVCTLSDHQNVFTGPPPRGGPQPSGYPNVIYYCSIDGGVQTGFSKATGCAKSLDGGASFVRAGEPAYTFDAERSQGDPLRCDDATGPGFVDRQGTVYLPRGFCGQPFLAVSHDEGATWDRVQVADKPLGTQIAGGQKVYNHEASVAVDRDGNVFYVWTANDRLAYMAVSRDGGKTFGRPRMIAPPGLKEVWNPAIDLGPGGRSLALSYMGSTNSPGPPFEGDYANVTFNGYLSVVEDPLAAEPTLYTASVNDPSDPLIKGLCEPVRCGNEFDFIDVVTGRDGTSMIDNCTATECAPFLGRVVIARLPAPGGPASSGATTPGNSAAGSPPREPSTCPATTGFDSVGVRPRRTGLSLGFARRPGAGPVDIDLFQQSRGRRVGERLVARFSKRTRSFRWNGRGDRPVTDGIYLLRFRTRGANGRTDVRRLTLRRAGGRFARRPDSYRRATCDLVPSFKLSRPVFGPASANLGIAYRVAADARVVVTVRRGSRLVRKFAASRAIPGRAYRLRLPRRGLPRGDYRVRLEATGPSSRVTTTLVSRRL